MLVGQRYRLELNPAQAISAERIAGIYRAVCGTSRGNSARLR
jgi:hypothetical protein